MADFLWRKQQPEIDDDGKIIKGGMWSHQREWWNLPNFIKALITGYGGGKSFSLAKRSISMTLHNSYGTVTSPFMCVSPSYKQAKRTIIPAIKELLDARRIKYRFNKTDHEFTIFRGRRKGIVWIGSGEDPDALKGSNLCGAGIDEPFIQKKEVFIQMLARIRDPRAKYLELLLTGTPEDLNWGYDVCAGDEKDRYDIGVVHASTMQNLALAKQFTDTLESAYDDRMRAAYVGGKFVSLSEGRIYYAFDRLKNFVPLIDDGIPLGVGMDFNVNPMTAVVFWVRGNHMHIVKEYEFHGVSNTDEMVSQIWDDFTGRLHFFYPDASGNSASTNAPVGQTDFRIIEEAGRRLRGKAFEVVAPKANPRRRDRFNCVNKKLDDATLTFDPSCKKLARYMERLTFENIKTNEGMTHLTDAMGYPVACLFNLKPVIEQGRMYYK